MTNQGGLSSTVSPWSSTMSQLPARRRQQCQLLLRNSNRVRWSRFRARRPVPVSRTSVCSGQRELILRQDGVPTASRWLAADCHKSTTDCLLPGIHLRSRTLTTTQSNYSSTILVLPPRPPPSFIWSRPCLPQTGLYL